MHIPADHRYLNFPIRSGAPKRWVKLDLAAGYAFEIELCPPDEAELWVFADLDGHLGQALELLPWDGDAETEALLAGVVMSAAPLGLEGVYQERYRPQLHFSTRRGWINDPNGLLYHDGVYHLFYQHNPYGLQWGNMHWGHATSPDLLHWTEQTPALRPDETGTMFSGCGIIDQGNASGLAHGDDPALLLCYTAAGGTHPPSKGVPFTQGLAYSPDGGRTWRKFAGNPVLGHVIGSNRDPKVIRHEPTGRWVMALYLEADRYALYGSENLRDWEQLSELRMPDCSECPDLFELPVDGEAGRRKWVFWGGNGSYAVGDFDGTTFHVETIVQQALNRTANAYAAQTWSNLPPADGRVVQIAWLQCAAPGMPFTHFMTFPCELALGSTQSGVRLHWRPLRELANLHEESVHRTAFVAEPGRQWLSERPGDRFHITAVIEPQGAAEVGIVVGDNVINYLASEGRIAVGERSARVELRSGRLHLELLVDRSSIEVFAAEGATYLPLAAVPNDPLRRIGLHVAGGPAQVVELAVHSLKSVWQNATP